MTRAQVRVRTRAVAGLPGRGRGGRAGPAGGGDHRGSLSTAGRRMRPPHYRAQLRRDRPGRSGAGRPRGGRTGRPSGRCRSEPSRRHPLGHEGRTGSRGWPSAGCGPPWWASSGRDAVAPAPGAPASRHLPGFQRTRHRSRCTGIADLLTRPQRLQPLVLERPDHGPADEAGETRTGMTEDRGAAGPYIEYDGLPVLHGSEVKLPLIHPYTPVEAGRYVTPGGGRLTIRKSERNSAHLRITLDHLGCPAQCTPPEGRRLPAARPGRGGLLRPCRVPPPSGVLGRGDALLRGAHRQHPACRVCARCAGGRTGRSQPARSARRGGRGPVWACPPSGGAGRRRPGGGGSGPLDPTGLAAPGLLRSRLSGPDAHVLEGLVPPRHGALLHVRGPWFRPAPRAGGLLGRSKRAGSCRWFRSIRALRVGGVRKRSSVNLVPRAGEHAAFDRDTGSPLLVPGDLGAEFKGHLDQLSRDRAVRLPPTLESPPPGRLSATPTTGPDQRPTRHPARPQGQ